MTKDSNLECAIRDANAIAFTERAAIVVWQQKGAQWVPKALENFESGDVIEFVVFGPGRHPIPCNVHAYEAWLSLLRSKAAELPA